MCCKFLKKYLYRGYRKSCMALNIGAYISNDEFS